MQCCVLGCKERICWYKVCLMTVHTESCVLQSSTRHRGLLHVTVLQVQASNLSACLNPFLEGPAAPSSGRHISHGFLRHMSQTPSYAPPRSCQTASVGHVVSHVNHSFERSSCPTTSKLIGESNICKHFEHFTELPVIIERIKMHGYTVFHPELQTVFKLSMGFHGNQR